MSDESASATAASDAASGAAPAAGRPGLWRRFVDRFVPADERRDALWIVGTATLLASARALAYQPLQRFVAARVFSPRVEELGFALRATAIADVLWGALAGLFILLMIRLARAPKATAFYIVLAGLLLALISLGNRLALNAVMELSGSEYARSLLSDLQPMMLASAEAVGVVIGAWVAQLASGEERPADGSTFLPAMGWSGQPLVGAARLAVAYVTVRAMGQLAAMLVAFAPQAYGIFASVKQIPAGIVVSWPSLFAQAATVAIYVLVGYFGVKRFGAPVTIWLAFMAAAVPFTVGALAFLPGQFALVGQSGGATMLGTLGTSAVMLTAWPLSAIPPFVGVWVATRTERASVPSATLPENNDHW